MKAVFKTRGQWFYCKEVPQEPNPEDFRTAKVGFGTEMKAVDWHEHDLALKNYQLEIKACKRYATRITNAWILDEMFPDLKEGDLQPVTIRLDVIVRAVEKYIPSASPSAGSDLKAKRKGGNMR